MEKPWTLETDGPSLSTELFWIPNLPTKSPEKSLISRVDEGMKQYMLHYTGTWSVFSFPFVIATKLNNFGCHLKTLMSGKLCPTLVNSLISLTSSINTFVNDTYTSSVNCLHMFFVHLSTVGSHFSYQCVSFVMWSRYCICSCFPKRIFSPNLPIYLL